MAKERKVKEARKKLLGVIKRAQTLGLTPQEIARLAIKRNLRISSSYRCWILAFLTVGILIAVPCSGYHKVVFNIYDDWKNGVYYQEKCAMLVPDAVNRIFRPPVYCLVCDNVTSVDKISGITWREFEKSYAYSGRPVIITDATKNWTALQVFSFEFFRLLYAAHLEKLAKHKCQFFPYKTDFKHLGEFLNLTEHNVNWSVPWYVGWSNCDVEVTEVLRNHYERPYFLPPHAEAKRLDWIFMGSKGYGAPMHIDNVEYPSWQAQLQGRKRWKLQPAPECFYSCTPLEVIVEPGEIIVLDTNRWFHSTEIVSEENSITIGAEFD